MRISYDNRTDPILQTNTLSEKSIMNLEKIALSIFLLIGTITMLVGFTYSTSGEIMSYHAEAIQTQWSELEPNYKGLLLGMVKGMGAGSFTAGFVTIIMSIHGLLGQLRPYRFLLPATVFSYYSLSYLTVYYIQENTAGQPPLSGVIIILALATIAAILLFVGGRQAQD